MGRPRTAIGTFGEFTYVPAPNGRIKARVRFRDDDGQLRLVQSTGVTRKSAERALKQKLTRRDGYSAGSRDLSGDSTFGRLVEVWLADLDLTDKLAPPAFRQAICARFRLPARLARNPSSAGSGSAAT